MSDETVEPAVPRFRRLRPDAPLPGDLLGSGRIDSESGHRVRATMLPSPARERAVQRVLAELRERAARLDRAADALRDLVLEHDAAVLLPSIAVPASMQLLDDADEDDAPATTTWDAKIEYLHGVALSGGAGAGSVTEVVSAETVERLGDVFDAARAQMLIDNIDAGRSDREAVDLAAFQLRNENLLDRMAGYACHLEEIDAAVFDAHRDFYVDRIGFCPSDVVRLVGRHVRETNRRANATGHALTDLMNSVTDDDLEKLADDDNAVATVRAFWDARRLPYLWTPATLADTTGLAESEVAAMFERLSARFGCQPDFRTPFDDNIARRYPLIALDDGSYLAPLPWSLAHSLHMSMCAIARDDSALATRYQKHRKSATEQVVHERLARVFGLPHTHARQHYVGNDAPGEIDTLVSGTRTIVAEAKSHTLTDRARRGYRDRIERVSDETVEMALWQTERAVKYIDDGNRAFSATQGGTPVDRLPPEVRQCFEIVVTLERMDPLATVALRLANRSQPAWVVSLADFLMVLDILDDPASLLDYIDRRSQAAAAGVEIIMESDALGDYLVGRLNGVIVAATNADANTTLMLGYSSAEINGYFTAVEMEIARDPLTTGVPASILRALASLYDETTTWERAARSVVDSEPKVWKTWRKFLRRHQLGRPFVIPGQDLAIVIDPEYRKAGLEDSVLRIPATG